MSNSGTGPGALIPCFRAKRLAARPYRGRAVWIIAALGLFGLLPAAANAADANPCNGSDLLCGKTLDQVVLPGTHNSMSAAELDWAIPNQTYSIPEQLTRGVRALLIDTHYGKPGSNGRIDDWKPNTDGDPQTNGAGTYLCHTSCSLGASDLKTELGKVAGFLSANPREVLVFVVQNGIDPDDYAKAVSASGLIDYVYRGSTEAYPTLNQMINLNQRVVMFSEGDTGSVPWFHDGYAGAVQETPYDFRKNEANESLTTHGGIDLLTQPATLGSTCRPNRGGTTGKLFLMNHWVNGPLDNSNPVAPDPAVAKLLNTREALVNRARACQTRRGKLPNIIAVDMFGSGDELGAVRELNGIPDPAPVLELLKPRAVTVKAKRKATFRVKVTNTGDAAATAAKVCATVPVKLARKPRCVTIASIPAGGSTVARLGLVTKKRYKKGSAPVRFMVFSNDSDQATLSTSARLTVKPLKKPGRKKR
ncbi:MAG: hypothetical protein ACSLFD_02840 [Solirubrobacterales bacterium]